jgi:hypothetical protein
MYTLTRKQNKMIKMPGQKKDILLSQRKKKPTGKCYNVAKIYTIS